MTFYKYLQLQPIDPQDDGSLSELDFFEQDEVIDLNQEADGEELLREWEEITNDLHGADSRLA